MSTTTGASGEWLAVAAILLGVVGLGYGLLVAPQSTLGGGWIAAVGVALLLSGAVATERVGTALGLSATGRRRLALALAVLAAFLFVTFLFVNLASFGAGSASGRG